MRLRRLLASKNGPLKDIGEANAEERPRSGGRSVGGATNLRGRDWGQSAIPAPLLPAFLIGLGEAYMAGGGTAAPGPGPKHECFPRFPTHDPFALLIFVKAGLLRESRFPTM